jgi:hypothetical protein
MDISRRCVDRLMGFARSTGTCDIVTEAFAGKMEVKSANKVQRQFATVKMV